MIQKICDSCERTIEVEDDLAGQKVACEACGDINIMPVVGSEEALEAVTATERLSKMGLPPDSGPEKPAIKVRPAMLRARPVLFMGLVVLIVVGIAGFAWGMYGMPNTVKTLAKFAGGIGAVVALGALGVWKVKTLSAALEITNKRTVYRKGLLSRATSEVVHDNIRNVQVTQSFWQRLWGVGTLGLSSSGQDGIEIEIGDIPNPDRVRKVIDAYRPLG